MIKSELFSTIIPRALTLKFVKDHYVNVLEYLESKKLAKYNAALRLNNKISV